MSDLVSVVEAADRDFFSSVPFESARELLTGLAGFTHDTEDG